MPSRSEITYFGAGPAALPTDVLTEAAQALLDYKGTGLGIAEHSHRSQYATDIVNAAKADLASYLSIPTEEYEILFMQGGGTGEFSATIYNLVGAWVTKQRERVIKETIKDGAEVKPGEESEEVVAALRKVVETELKLDYIVTGSWSLKAYQEALRLLGPEYVNLAVDARKASGADGKFGAIPDESEWKLSKFSALVYYCDNETVDGVEFRGFPKLLETKSGQLSTVAADMSSNILSRKVPVKNFGMFFFGAQKNLGSTGVTVAVVRKDLLVQPSPILMRKLGLPIAPAILVYEYIAKNNSLYNTLSIFDVYIAGQVLQKLLKTYPDKVNGQEAVSDKKAKIIYDALERHSDVYKIVPAKATRSRMNICFRVIKGGNMEEAEKTFLKESVAQNLTGLKGHRSVGGIRASNYNSIPLEGAEKLAKFIDEFAKS